MAAEESKMDYRDVKFDFTVPSFDTYDIEDIEDIEDVQDFPDFAAPTTAVLDLPEIPDIPDVTADFDYDYGGVPNFTVPDTTTAKLPSTDSSSSKQNKSSKKKKKEKKKKDDDYEHVVNDPWQLRADNGVVSEEEEGGEEEKKSASNTTSNKKDKKKNKASKTATEEDTQQQQQQVFDPVGITTKLDMSSAPLKLSLDGEDEEDDEEYKQKAKALLEEHLKQPLEDIESFPRKGKNPKKPKRDQEDIPKTLVTGGTKTQRQLSIRQLATAESTEQPPPPQTTTEPPQPTTTRPPAITTTTTSATNNNKTPARPLIVQEGGADIASLLFEGAASMEERQVEIALEELSQAFLSSHTKCTEAIDLGGHGIVVVTMRKWGYNKKIQQLGCECLHNIVFNYKQHPMQLDLFDALAVMGALETVIEGMDQFPESLGVQRFGLAALGNLLVGKKTSTRLQARTHKAVQELDAITTVVGGMRRFPNNVMVQGCGCIVLAAFLKANPGDYKSKIVEAGAVLDVAAAVTNHPTNALIEKEASAFMKVYFGWQQQLTAASSAASTVNGV